MKKKFLLVEWSTMKSVIYGFFYKQVVDFYAHLDIMV